MLTPDQQDAFFHLGVCSGGCSEAAAVAIAAAEPALLAQLVRANLVKVADGRITLWKHYAPLPTNS
ncbi:MAG: hypothetical protein HC804_13810 [Anaerolineae bacterium]|nr:hypothetical protein [Anaerolineae bacterium]